MELIITHDYKFGLVFRPSLKVEFESQMVGGLSYCGRETIPAMGGSNREDQTD